MAQSDWKHIYTNHNNALILSLTLSLNQKSDPKIEKCIIWSCN